MAINEITRIANGERPIDEDNAIMINVNDYQDLMGILSEVQGQLEGKI